MWVIVLTGCGATPTTNPTQTWNVALESYQSSGFMIWFPKDWTHQENVYWAQVMFFAPQATGDQFRENVSVVTEQLPAPMTVSDYYTAVKTQLTQLISGYQEITNEDIDLNGVAAKKLVYKGSQSNYALQRTQVIVIKDTTAYVISYTATADTYSDFVKEVDTIIASFTVQ